MERDQQDPPEGGLEARDFLRNLNQLIRQAVADQAGAEPEQAPLRERVRFKVPNFDGKGDVELFIDQLDQLIQAQEWDEATAVLKAREGLTGNARNCGRHATWPEIAESLRLHYGMTAMEASAKLSSYRHASNQSLAEYGFEVQRLVEIAYADTPAEPRTRLAMERFRLGLTDTGLQGHLLARQPGTLEDMIRAGSEYLQVVRKTSYLVKGRRLEDSDEMSEESPMLARVASQPESASVMLKAVQELTAQVGRMQTELQEIQRRGPGRPNREKPNSQCWGCKKEGHLRRNCPTHPWEQGNAEGPRQ